MWSTIVANNAAHTSQCRSNRLMTEREDELAWHERVLDEKEHELNRIEDMLAEKERKTQRQLWRRFRKASNTYKPSEADE